MRINPENHRGLIKSCKMKGKKNMETTKKAVTISILNNKGGVGKTSSCTAIASILGMIGHSCLVIDNDFQANATMTFLSEEDASREVKGITDLFRMRVFTEESVKECITHTPYPGVDIVASRPEHQGTESYLLANSREMVIHKQLRKAIRQVEDEYDFILIDTHPDLNVVAQNALCCSDYVLTPVSADGYSFQGLTPLTNGILQISQDEDLNPNLKLLGVFVTNNDMQASSYDQFCEFYRSELGDKFIPITIRQDAAIAAVTTYLCPLPSLLSGLDYRVKSTWKGVYDYIELLRQVELIDDVDYLVARSTMEIINRTMAIHIADMDAPLPTIDYVELTPKAAGRTNEKYRNPWAFEYEDIVKALNETPELLEEVRKSILRVADPEYLLRFILPNQATTLVKASALQEEEE